MSQRVLSNASLDAAQLHFQDCSASPSGGGVYLSGDAGCEWPLLLCCGSRPRLGMQRPEAELADHGLSCHADTGTTLLHDISFLGCSANSSGGALYVELTAGSTRRFSGLGVRNSSVFLQGGGMMITTNEPSANHSLTISDSVFSQ